MPSLLVDIESVDYDSQPNRGTHRLVHKCTEPPPHMQTRLSLNGWSHHSSTLIVRHGLAEGTGIQARQREGGHRARPLRRRQPADRRLRLPRRRQPKGAWRSDRQHVRVRADPCTSLQPQWVLEEEAENQWLLRNVETGLYLAVEGEAEDGASAIAIAQPTRWTIAPDEEDSSTFRCAAPPPTYSCYRER